MSLLLFLITILVSFVVVRIGAIAFELTGLEWNLAKFQALSCFTGTGFTTKEAELITTHAQRRKIATGLMILGNAGFMTLIATFANSLQPNSMINQFWFPGLRGVMPMTVLPWVNLLVLLSGIFIAYKIFTFSGVASRFRKIIRGYFTKNEIIKQVSFEELMLATGGYGITQIEICSSSPILNKKIFESELRQHDITILTVERDGKTIPNPSSDTVVMLGDHITCFGRLDHIRKELCVESIKDRMLSVDTYASVS
jgi:hypothetical protein